MEQDLIATPVNRLACSRCGHEIDVTGREAFSNIICEQCNTRLTVPAQLGAFLLVERMGTGGMGSVYRALDTTLNRFVAIKVMKPSLGEDAALVESFLREARAAAALNHRNIVQIYSCGQESGQPYIVMELVPGGRMSQMFGPGKPMDEVELLKIALDVAEGLRAANEAGLVHGDIKPENVLIDQSGTAKIADFGLAQFVNAQKDRGEIWGTPYYISPERARGNRADHRSDIYSLGASMFHALAGQPPFDADTAVDVVLARLKHPPPKLGELCPGLQKQTVEAVERAMAADPFLRYPNSASLKGDIAAALKAAKEARESAKPRRRRTNTASLVIAGFAVAVLAGLTIGALSWLRHHEAAPAPPARPPATPAAKPDVPPPPAADDVVVLREEVKGKDGKMYTRISVTFFTPEEEARLAAAIRLLDSRPPLEAQKKIDAFGKQLPRTSPSLVWIPLLETVPLWISSQPGKATASLELVNKFILRQPTNHPAHMPQVLARRLLGKMSGQDFEAYRQQWPAWYGDLANLMAGVSALAGNNAAMAGEKLNAYLAARSGGPAWVYAFRPAVLAWKSALAETEDVMRQVELCLARETPAPARYLLQAMEAESPALFAGLTVDAWSRVDALEKKQRAAREESEARRHRARVQQDLDRLDTALAGLSGSHLRNRDFRRAALSISNLPSDMQTPEGRMAAEWLREALERLEGLKAFLVQGVERQPFTRTDGSDLGGDVISASAAGVRVTLDGRTTTPFGWDAISLRTYVRMIDFYAALPALGEKERAGALTTLVLFSAMNGAFDPALNFARRAMDLDPEQKKEIRRLVPGLLSDG